MDIISEEVTLVLIASAFLLLVSVGMVVLFLVYQKRQLRLILEKKELQSQMKEALLQTKMEAQEETLTYVGRELHDNVGQLLSTAKLFIARLDTTPPFLDTHELINQTLATAIAQVRALSKSLTTDWLNKFDLIENLQAEAARLNNRSGIVIELQHPATVAIGAEQQIMLFRMVQEAIQNAIKHGVATTIRIELQLNGSRLQISIEDNGCGFAVEQTASGVGMMNIKTRAKLLGGVANWKSNGNGTLVTIEVPYAS